MSFEKAEKVYNDYRKRYGFVKGSDSHSLNTFGDVYTEFYSEKNDFESFLKYIKNE